MSQRAEPDSPGFGGTFGTFLIRRKTGVMNWEVIGWTCVTVGVLFVICLLVLNIISAMNMKKNREAMKELQEKIEIGARVLFGGGIYGKIVKIKGDVIDVEMAKGLVVQISRYGIQDVVSEK